MNGDGGGMRHHVFGVGNNYWTAVIALITVSWMEGQCGRCIGLI